MADKSFLIDGVKALNLILKMQPAIIDDVELRSVFGGLESASLDQVARAFGVTSATVKHTWRPAGMPVIASRRGVGSRVSLADVLIWLLKRNAANKIIRGADDYTERKRDAETRAVEAEARIKESKAEQVEGGHVSIDLIVSLIGAIANRTRDAFMRLPDKYKPTWPAKYAQEWAANMETDIRAILTMLSEVDESAIREQLDNREN